MWKWAFRKGWTGGFDHYKKKREYGGPAVQVADAVIGNVQERTIKQYNASNSEVTPTILVSHTL